MLKTDKKHKPTHTPILYQKPPSLSKHQNLSKASESKEKNLPRQYFDKTTLFSGHLPRPREYAFEKQNHAMNQNTPKIQQPFYQDLNSEDMDQLSQIKFISKECSSIKQNQNEWNSQTFSGNHLEDFSPLFDRSDKNTDKDEFILQIEDISEEDILFEKIQSAKMKKRMSLRPEQQLLKLGRKPSSYFNDYDEPKPLLRNTAKNTECSSRGGKIKKNKPQTFQTLQQTISVTSQSWIDKEIKHIFCILNQKDQEELSQSNCSSEDLSTQLNYFIGSIITKIKVKGKCYNFVEFSKEFKSLIVDSDAEELQEILSNQRNKKSKMSMNRQYDNFKSDEKENNDLQQISSTFPLKQQHHNKDFNSKLTKISQKLSTYLSKNNILTSQSQVSKQETSNSGTNLQKRQDGREKTAQSGVSSQSNLEERARFVSSVFSDTLKMECSFRNDLQVIRGMEGQQFSLTFTELNKHL